MTDKELLELAAKAARYAFRKEISQIGIDLFYVDGHRWNPLTDDGDALRLAVKLKMEVSVWHSDTTIQTDEVATITLDHRGDPYATTRRAIVRVAAAIGWQMK